MAIPGPTAVLEDPTGGRARWMRRAGRLVFLLFLAWLLAIVLGGLGLMPLAGIPLTHVLRPSQGPPPLAKLPKAQPPAPADLLPAVPAAVFAAGTGKAATARKVAPGQLKKSSTATVAHGKSAVAPGQLKKISTVPVTPGKSAVAPGQLKKTSTVSVVHGKSAVAPGQVKTTSTVPAAHGKSAAAPGQTKTTTTTLPPGHAKKP